MPDVAPNTNDLFEIIRITRSMRRFEARLGAERAYRKIFEAGSCAPSGGSIQRRLFLVIRDPDIEIGSHRSRALTAIAIKRQDLSSEWHGPTPRLGFVRRH